MRCSRCGNVLPENSRFCPSCSAPAVDGAVADVVPVRTRPGVVTLLAVLNYVGAAGGLLCAVGVFAFVSPARTFALVAAAILLGMAVLSALCANGLWKLRSHGRTIQLVFSWIGLLLFPLGTLIHTLILIYLFRPGVKLLFSGRPFDQLNPQEAQQVRAIAGPNIVVIVIVLAVLLVGAVPTLGIIAAIAIPNLLNAIDRGKQKRTIADIRSIGTAVESYAVDTNLYPMAADLSALQGVLVPVYIRSLPLQDGWKNSLVFEPRGEAGYEIRSFGKDGTRDPQLTGGPTTSFNADIVLENGEFIQYPEGQQQ